MNKIAILSDSHHKTDLMESAIKHLKSLGAQAIVHCGDFQIKQNLQLLTDSKLPYVSVFGNNDMTLLPFQNDFKIYKEPHYFKIGDLKCKVMHLPYYLTPDTDIVFFGHTHMFEAYKKENTLFVNPGEICARNKPLSECALLEINKDSYIIKYYSKAITDTNYKEEEFIYER
jgi:putative phosphoesterase